MSLEPRGVDIMPSRQIAIEAQGADGYGPPAEREPEMLARDYRGGRFSTAYLKEHYRFDPKSINNPEKGKKP